MKPVAAAWLSYYGFNIGFWGVGSAVGGGIIGGTAGTLAGATIAGATTSLIMTGSLQATWSYAANFALGSYLTNFNYLQNPIDQFESLAKMISAGDIGELASSAGGMAMNHQFSRLQSKLAQRWGMSSMDLNTALMGTSVLGNELVGTRFEDDDHVLFKKTGGIGFKGILNRKGLFGLPFDVVDIALGYQGLPTASFRDYAYSGLLGRPVSGHSLGTLDAINAYGRGMASGGGRLDSVPFGKVAPTALQVNIGTLDFVNGLWFGKIFNPGARLCSMSPTGHPHANYLQVCQ